MKIKLLAFLALVFLTANAHAVLIQSDVQGWIHENGSTNTPAAGAITFTGHSADIIHRSFARFDLSGLTGTVVSADITLNTSSWRSGIVTGQQDTINFYDLAGQPVGIAGFTDAGTGALYGNAVFTSGIQKTVSLSAQAISDISSSLGSTFFIGFTAPDHEAAASGDEIGVYTNGVGSPASYFAPRLDLSFTAVPEPSVLALLGIGLAGIGFARKKKLA